MSLINDALKRAREAQQHAPPPTAGEPQLRPAEPEPHARQNLGLLVPVTFALVALGGLVMIWALHHKPVEPPQVAARSQASAPSETTVPKPADPAVNGADANSHAAVPPSATTQQSAPRAPAVAVASPSLSPTNPVPVPQAPAKPPPPRLQGIVFNPRRPCAMIDGKTLFIGDRLGAFKVVAITPETVTLSDAGITNVLSLSE